MDEKGKVVDPFVPKFDIMKVTDLNKEIRKSQKVNVESPRFVGTLQRALEEMFDAADKDKSGALSYQEFADAFKTLSYGLTDNDIKTLIALADDDKDNKITWKEFIPVAIDSIKTFFSRNKALHKMKEKDREVRKEALKLIQHDEIAKCGAIMRRKFRALDEKNTGFVSLLDFRKAMSACALLTPKEVNVIIRSFKEGETQFEYKMFETVLFETRFELAKSRLMDTNISKMVGHLIEEFQRLDKAGSGKISITQIRQALFDSKKANLTPFQVFSLVGMAQPDEHGLVHYRHFAEKCTAQINEFYSVQSITTKADMLDAKYYVAPGNLEQISMTNLELFEVFKKYDRNENGFLEIHEYI